MAVPIEMAIQTALSYRAAPWPKQGEIRSQQGDGGKTTTDQGAGGVNVKPGSPLSLLLQRDPSSELLKRLVDKLLLNPALLNELMLQLTFNPSTMRKVVEMLAQRATKQDSAALMVLSRIWHKAKGSLQAEITKTMTKVDSNLPNILREFDEKEELAKQQRSTYADTLTSPASLPTLRPGGGLCR